MFLKYRGRSRATPFPNSSGLTFFGGQKEIAYRLDLLQLANQIITRSFFTFSNLVSFQKL